MKQDVLISIERSHLLKIINIWNYKFPNSPIPEWIRKRYDKLYFQLNVLNFQK